MNRYYDNPYEDTPSCGPGNHATKGGWANTGRNPRGDCIKCGVYPDRELEQVVASIPKGTGKHRKEE